MLKLSDADRGAIRSMHSAKVLVDVDGHRLDPRGVIMVTCADGDQFFDKFEHMAGLFQSNGRPPRIHTFGWNGGALRIPIHSPIHDGSQGFARFARKEIQDARAMKEMDMVALFIHAPCGKARECNMAFTEEVEFLFAARILLKRWFPGIKVACFCHIDYGNIKRTYFISRQNWTNWTQAP